MLYSFILLFLISTTTKLLMDGMGIMMTLFLCQGLYDIL